MQNQNFWNDSYSPSEYSEKHWMTGVGRNSDEFCNSYSINPESHPIGPYDEFFTYTNDIPSNSINNMELASQLSTIPSNNVKTSGVPNNDLFVDSSTFAESLIPPSNAKNSDEKHINGQLLSDSDVMPFNVSQSRDDINPSLSTLSKLTKRRNSLPSNYASDKQLNIDSEIQPIYNTDIFEINSPCSSSEVIKVNSSDNLSWTNCYAPDRKHTTSVVSSERGLDSLVNKLFTDEQKKRYLASKKKQMESKKEENKQMDMEAAYKSFLESMTNSQNSSVFDNRDITSDTDEIVVDDKMFLCENSDDCIINTTSNEIDMNSENPKQVIFISNPVPEETSIDISGSPCLTINTDSNQQEVEHMDCETIDERTISENVLASATAALFKTVPFPNVGQNVNLITECIKTPFYDSIDIKGDTNSSAGNFTNDEISDSLDKIFTQTSVSDDSDILYSIRSEQADEATFDFDTGKLIPLNISTENSDDAYAVISDSTQENFKILKPEVSGEELSPDQLSNSKDFKVDQDLESKENDLSVFSTESKCLQDVNYFKNVSSSHANENFLDNPKDINSRLTEERKINFNLSVKNYSLQKDIFGNIVNDLKNQMKTYSVNEQKGHEIPPNDSVNIDIELCDNSEKFIDISDGNSSLTKNAKTDIFFKNIKDTDINTNLVTNEKNVLFVEDEKEQLNISINDSQNCEKDLNSDENNISLFKSSQCYINTFCMPDKKENKFSPDNENIENDMHFDTGEKLLDSSNKANDRNEVSLINNKNSSNAPCESRLHESENLDVNESLNTKIQYFKHSNECLETPSHKFQSTHDTNSSSKARKSFMSKFILKSSDNAMFREWEDSNEIQRETHDVPITNHILSTSDVENVSTSGQEAMNSLDFNLKSSQKSRKSFCSLNSDSNFRKKTARKSSLKSCGNDIDNVTRQMDVNSFSSDSEDKLPKRKKFVHYLRDEDYGTVENMNSSTINNASKNKRQCIALKTFKKPFTAAKKSIIEKTAFKTVIQSYFGIRTAMKTCKSSGKVQNANIVEKDGSAVIITLQDKSDLDLSVDELSSDETKSSSVYWSPLKDLKLLKSVCCCSADEILCLCNGEQLQLICEAEDTINEKIVPCMRSISHQYLLTPSSEIKCRAFCDIHLWRLKKHHCCPKCGIFCTQGSFLYCDNSSKGEKEDHFFHQSCFLIPDTGLPPGCPHCCRFSNFKNVNLTLFENDNEEIDTNLAIGFDARNLTQDLESYDLFMIVQDSEVECASNVNSAFLIQKQDLETMLMAVSEETSLRLRPAGKCLFNPIKNNDVKKVLQLIANGVNPNHKFTTHKNNTPLHIAAFYGSTGIIHALLQCGALIDAINDDLETPLILAVEKDQTSVVRYLIHAGAQVDVKNENGLTAFHVACKNNCKEIAELLFNTGKFDVNLQDDGGWTPLVWACEHNYVGLIQWLLNLDADPNVRDNEENTALHWAACSGNNDILEMLLDNGCNLGFVNQRGDSALHIAARKDNYICVKLLLERGALLDCVNKDNETPLMCCDKDSRSRRILNKHLLTSSKPECNSLQQHVGFRDISRGTEKYPIQAVNEVDQQEFIMDFRYITANCFASNINVTTTVDSMQLCYCKDNCSSRDCTCTSISRCWYDMDGRLLSDFNMGNPPSIYECNKTCHCPKSCINRVVQQGLKHPLQLFRTLDRGWGVRTLRDLSKGTFVCEYVGEVIPNDEVSRRTDDTYLFDLESKKGKTGEYSIDARFYGNIARFINHSCDPNLVGIQVFVEHQDLNFPRIAFFTRKDVKAFEELCFDYGMDFWLPKSKTILCTCNSSLCKYSKDSIDMTLQAIILQFTNAT
ncbi:histone-lysine N-methyltransferase EHMT2 [Trichonephila inaurata madagascariensis]|uniref:Histone-lysine N-methyltransferase EHMT2 n=1 Tax=Trichonephila inaurata madagascariensis TaxID=2747483 RepID=A0A8X6YDV5_9ARAC|nr:histone-lysine N-methyltransferase EHMT2 [Trichonephila inaurata madagascariensis]